MKLIISTATLAIGTIFSAVDAFADETDTSLGTVQVNSPDWGGGHLDQQDAPYGQTTITRPAIAQAPASANVAQLLATVPGVNMFSRDPTGIFGGGYSMRGYDSTQIELNMNGIPQNDPSTGNQIPQAYIDNENLCSVTVTQGATEASSHSTMGATGGSIGMSTCAPKDKVGLDIRQSFGSFQDKRTFVRLDTGSLGDRFKAFASFSETTADMFAGYGSGERKHVDGRAVYEISPGNSLTLDGFWTNMNNNFTRTLTSAQYSNWGYQGWGNQAPTTLLGSAANVKAQATVSQNGLYYKDTSEPGEWYSTSLAGQFRLSNSVSLRVTPYFWHQYSGSTSSTNPYTDYSLKNGAVSGMYNGVLTSFGVVNSHAAANATDQLVVGLNNSMIDRAGVKSEVTWLNGIQTITAGNTYEYTWQHQLNPLQVLNADGSLQDTWFQNSSTFLRDEKGNIITTRDWKTNYQVVQPYLSDKLSLLGDRLTPQIGLRAPITTRTFHNLPSDQTAQVQPWGSGAGYKDYSISHSYFALLPSAGVNFAIDQQNQVFLSGAVNQRVPPNFIDQGLVNQATGAIMPAPYLKAEMSENFDLGYRFQNSAVMAQGTLFRNYYNNRMARFSTTSNGSVSDSWANVGNTVKTGVELQAGTKPVSGFSLWASGSYIDDRMQNNVTSSTGAVYLTSGKEYFNTPHFLGNAGVTYEDGPLTAGVVLHYTGKVYTTLVNDQSLPGYATVDLNLSYRLGDLPFDESGFAAREPTFSLLVKNLFNKHYLTTSGASSSGPSLTAAQNPSYYLGSPLFIVGTASMNF